MTSTVPISGRVAAWLLCAMLAWLTVNPPQCDLCDGLPVAGSPSPALVHHHTPVVPDACNGVCACCVLCGLPAATPPIVAAPEAARFVSAVYLPPPDTLPQTPFRPPRTDLHT